jgi:hypothetical protein
MSIFSRSSRLRASVALAAVATLCAVSRMDAQSTRLADSLLQSGVLMRAESLYYAAVRARPSDPNARQALGRYLVSRGAPRVGATLLEEAIRFGGDKPAIERELAPIYLATGEFHSLRMRRERSRLTRRWRSHFARRRIRRRLGEWRFA